MRRSIRSLLRQTGLAQTGEICGFEQGADPDPRILGRPEKTDGLQAGDARKAIVAAPPACFGEFLGGAFGVAFEGEGGGYIDVNGLRVKATTLAVFDTIRSAAISSS